MKIEKKVDAKVRSLLMGKGADLKHFIELQNIDRDIVADKAIVEKVNNYQKQKR
jgi:hypothetical protein